ncbi:MAG: tryptophan synthase subunit alpha [Actinobacteria bacterium]|nr:tryptophan synthase subunit alpha [Actinomycetota bacterium]
MQLEARLRELRSQGRKLLVPYVTGGIRDDWVDIARAMVDGGADALEIGIPFSDPAMDGPTIQEASAVALARGTTPASVFADLRGADLGVPLVAMTYYNLVFRAGHQRFAEALASSGICAAIVPDLCLEESREWEAEAAQANIETVLLAAPVTPDDRMAAICERSRGFVYGVGLMGVTGARPELAASTAELATRLKAHTDRPVLMGFGISTPDQAAEVAASADGVIVASALMRPVLDGASSESVGALVQQLRSGLDQTTTG